MNTQELVRQILNELPENRAGRSSLCPYRELILEMRRRNYSYREIADVLSDRCGLHVSRSTIHDFVKRHSFEQPQSAPLPGPGIRHRKTSSMTPDDSDATDLGRVRERIAAMKSRPPLLNRDESGFKFDPAQPLRLDE